MPKIGFVGHIDSVIGGAIFDNSEFLMLREEDFTEEERIKILARGSEGCAHLAD
jgi:hypothetical protein